MRCEFFVNSDVSASGDAARCQDSVGFDVGQIESEQSTWLCLVLELVSALVRNLHHARRAKDTQSP
jgi:hypothetical protein